MKTLSTHEMESVQGRASIFDLIISRVTNPSKPNKAVDPFMDNMKKMFGASAGRDLANVAKKIGLVGVVNSIFGW